MTFLTDAFVEEMRSVTSAAYALTASAAQAALSPPPADFVALPE